MRSGRGDAADPEAVVRRQLDAYNSRDIDAFMACYSESVEITKIAPSSRRVFFRRLVHTIGSRVGVPGRPTFRDVYDRLFRECPELHAEVVQRIKHRNVVIDHERVTGQRGRDTFEAIAVYVVSDGLIERVWFID